MFYFELVLVRHIFIGVCPFCMFIEKKLYYLFSLLKNLCWICSYILLCISDSGCLYFFSWSISAEVCLVSFSKANCYFISTFPCHFAIGLSVADSMQYVFLLSILVNCLHILWLLMYLNLFLHFMLSISMP